MSQRGRDNNNKDKKESSILGRVKVLYIVFFVVCLLFLVQIVLIQTNKYSDELRVKSEKYSFKRRAIEATRGNILSDDRRILATSIPYYELRMDMVARGLDIDTFMKEVTPLSVELSRFFGDRSPKEYREALVGARQKANGYFRINPRKINYLELQQVKKFPLFSRGANKGGFIPVEIGRRVQPHGKLASRSIGFVNSNGLKVGIEGGFDEYLRGKDGMTMMQKVSGNFWIPVSSEFNLDPVNGMDVVTTIDIDLQDFVQAALQQRLTEAEADWGTVMVMEVKTGHIKAIANATRKNTGEILEDYNYAVGMSMEPGSTFKLASLIALLEQSTISISEIVHTGGGHTKIGVTDVYDVTRGGYGSITMKQVFEKSSNVGFAMMVNKYFASRPGIFSETISKLGLGKELGLQIAGEARPLVKHPNLKNGWDGTTLTNMSYGYAVRVTPIQTLALYNAVANGGRMIKPLFVKELLQYGKVVESYQTQEVVPQICSPKNLAIIREAMEGVVLNGTGKSLRNSQYRVAAKTGTAQIALGNKGYRDNGGMHYLGSVAGYFPADKPQYTIMIAIKTFRKDGSNKPYYGGALSAPLFRSVADHIHATNFDFVQPLSRQTLLSSESALDVKPGSRQEFETLLRGVGMVVPSDIPALRENDMMVMDSGKIERIDLAHAANTVGLALGDAVRLLESRGFKVATQGRGRVASQVLDSVQNRVYLVLE